MISVLLNMPTISSPSLTGNAVTPSSIIFLAAAQRNIPVFEYTPNQVKQAITGSGRADKKQMQDMIMRLLGLKEIPEPDDAADGLSIALCHLNLMR